MKSYYYFSDGAQHGPVSAEELAGLVFDGDVLVWCKGMKDWTPASEVDELKDILGTTPPPPPPPGSGVSSLPPRPPVQNNAGARPQPSVQSNAGAQPAAAPLKEPTNYMVYAVLATVLCCVPTGIASIIYTNKATAAWTAGKYAEAEAATKSARLWLIVSVCAGGVGILIGFIFGLLLAFPS